MLMITLYAEQKKKKRHRFIEQLILPKDRSPPPQCGKNYLSLIWKLRLWWKSTDNYKAASRGQSERMIKPQ